MNTKEFDVVVIGAGPVGENVAQYAHEGGLEVALVEQELLGGECSYYACMPSKALLRPIEVFETVNHLPGLHSAQLDIPALLARRDQWVSYYDDANQVRWAEENGLTVYRGRGQFKGPKKVMVLSSGKERSTEIELMARKAVVIATGSKTKIPEMYKSLAPWDNRDATGIVEIPESIIVIGGGVVAVESATWLAALGSQVTLLVRGDHLLGDLGAEVEGLSQVVTTGLEKKGVTVRFNTVVHSAQRPEVQHTGLGKIHGGQVELQLDHGETLVSSEIMVATGRIPSVDSLGLENLQLTPQDLLEGNLPQWLYVVGDASGKTALTHQGKYQARVLGSALAGQGELKVESKDVPTPQVIFSHPQVAHVGWTLPQTEKQGIRAVAVRAQMNEVAGSLLLSNSTPGFGELIVEGDTGKLLGATFVGHEVADLIHAATVAVLAQLPVGLLRHAVPAYPTSSEIWLRLLEKLPVEFR